MLQVSGVRTTVTSPSPPPLPPPPPRLRYTGTRREGRQPGASKASPLTTARTSSVLFLFFLPPRGAGTGGSAPLSPPRTRAATVPVLPGSARDLDRMKTRSPTAGKYREGGGCSLHLDEGWGSTLAVMGVCVILWPMHMHMHTVVVSGMWLLRALIYLLCILPLE